MQPELSVIVPTRNRQRLLLECVERIAEDGSGLPIELIVVDDGSSDATVEVAREFANRAQVDVAVLAEAARGPASARNRGIERAAGTACLFIGDDVLLTAGSLARHLQFHRDHGGAGEGLLGRVVPRPPLDRSEFVRWLHEEGVQFGYGRLDPARPVAPQHFWTANASAKSSLLRSAGGFDEAFSDAACEDAELGVRMGRMGLRLTYDPAALAQHFHPTDLAATLVRMRRVGRASRLLAERTPEIAAPSRPRMRHRIKAAGLTILKLAGVRPAAIRPAIWRFLCDEIQREEFWGVRSRNEGRPRIGGLLARLAVQDPKASI